MWIALLATALAQPPPLPTWTAADRPTYDDADSELGSKAGPATDEGAQPQSQAVDPVSIPHGWLDDDSLTVALAGDLGNIYYLTMSARRGPMVAHWQQGPIAGEDQTTYVDVEPLPGLTDALRDVGDADLTVRVHVQTWEGVSIGKVGLPVRTIEAAGDRMVRSAREPDADLTADQIIDPAALTALRGVDAAPSEVTR